MAVFQLRLLRTRSSAIESRVFTAIRRQRARGGDTLTSLLDVHAPYRAVRRSTRPSQDWFDADYRAAKRSLERVYRRHPATDTLAAWKNLFSTQRRLFRQKASDYWSTTIAESVA